MTTCPTCQHENEDSGSVCVQCNRVLDVRGDGSATIRISKQDLPSEFLHTLPPQLAAKQQIQALELRVLDHPRSILLTKKEVAILGRTSPYGQNPTVDLTDYKAYTLGVSRNHASIEVRDDSCILRDLGSANGTWLNGTWLSAYTPYALNDGDKVLLGKLYLVVHIHLQAESRSWRQSNAI